MERIIGYARVSTEIQAITNALDQQKSRLINDGATEIFWDVESGNKRDREQLNKVLDLVKNKQVTEVIATRWDRVSRNLLLYLEVKEIFRYSGVKLRFLDGGEVDLETAAGELYADMQAVFSASERRMLRERVNKGFEARRKRQVAWTRPPWGYNIVNEKYELDRIPLPYCLLIDRPDNYLELEDEPDNSSQLFYLNRAKIARDIFDCFLYTRKTTNVLIYIHEKYGLNKNQISLIPDLNSFPTSSRGIKQWLQNPIFQGHTAYLKYKKDGGVKSSQEWEIHRDTHPQERLITEAEAEEVKSILASNTKRFGQTDATFYLTGFIFCQQCKSKCILKSTAGKYRCYSCRHSANICNNRKGVSITKIEKAIITELVSTAFKIAEQPQLYKSQKSSRLSTLEQQYSSLEAIPDIDFNPILKKAKEDLLRDIELERLQLTNTGDLLIRNPIARKINFWYTLTQQEREIFYDQLIERVVIFNGDVVSVVLKLGLTDLDDNK